MTPKWLRAVGIWLRSLPGRLQDTVNWGNVPQWISAAMALVLVGFAYVALDRAAPFLQNERLREDNARLEKDVAPLRAEAGRLMGETRSLADANRGMEEQAARLRAEVSVLAASKEQAEREAQQLRNEMSALGVAKERIDSEATRLRRDLISLRVAKGQADGEAARLRTEIEALVTARTELDAEFRRIKWGFVCRQFAARVGGAVATGMLSFLYGPDPTSTDGWLTRRATIGDVFTSDEARQEFGLLTADDRSRLEGIIVAFVAENPRGMGLVVSEASTIPPKEKWLSFNAQIQMNAEFLRDLATLFARRCLQVRL